VLSKTWNKRLLKTKMSKKQNLQKKSAKKKKNLQMLEPILI